MHFPSMTLFLPAVAFLAPSVAAFAFPAPQYGSECNSCMDFAQKAQTCGFDMTATTADYSEAAIQCMCKADGMQSLYENCMTCMVTNNYISADGAAQGGTAFKQGCAQMTGSTDSSSSSGSGTTTGSSSSYTGTASTSSSGSGSGSGSSSGSGSGSSTGTGSSTTNSGSTRSNGNSVLGSGAGALSIGSGQVVLGALAAAGMGFYAL